eukprot:TRINITY_DN37823_c0_g1_i1.p1 TRINITY_DN37823_c0_g1~~TRINITY_DN37823_c0_g1_i1.p1  ORF type:complete len:329 (+),score=68.53 TRINITY_DN37823_c0_g1_i1:113-1099(+)
MPELPEAEFARRLAEKHLAGKRISAVRFVDDRIVFEGVLAASFAKALKGRKVVACRRWGKQLWFDLDCSPHPTFHLGMTGTFQIKGQSAIQYVRAKNDSEGVWPPRFWKVELQMADGTCFAFTNARRFGRIRLLKDPANEPPVCDMGFDPLINMAPLQDFSRQLCKRTADIKAVLLDQGFAAGVGNWVADEVLYQAAIHPQEKACNLKPSAITSLHKSLANVVQTACKTNANSGKFPKTWLFHYRWVKMSPGGATSAKDGRGRPLKFVTSGGRTTAYVPSLQRLGSSSSLKVKTDLKKKVRAKSSKVRKTVVVKKRPSAALRVHAKKR